MRIAILVILAGLGACSRQPGSTVDVSAAAAERAEANIDNYATNAQVERYARRPASR